MRCANGRLAVNISGLHDHLAREGDDPCFAFTLNGDSLAGAYRYRIDRTMLRGTARSSLRHDHIA